MNPVLFKAMVKFCTTNQLLNKVKEISKDQTSLLLNPICELTSRSDKKKLGYHRLFLDEQQPYLRIEIAVLKILVKAFLPNFGLLIVVKFDRSRTTLNN